MVARGNGTDGWHRELADSWRLKTLFLGGGRGQQTNTQQRKREDDRFPLSLRLQVSGRIISRGKGSQEQQETRCTSAQRELSAPPALHPAPLHQRLRTPSPSPRWLCPGQVTALPRNSRPWDSDRAKSRLRERGERWGCWLWRSGCL